MESEEKKEEQKQQKSGGGSGTIIGIVIVVVILAVAGFFYKQHAKQKVETAMQTPEKKVNAKPTSSLMATAQFKDGTYTAEGDYTTHVGPEHIKVTVTLKKDIITNVDVVSEANDPMSQHYQGSFISGYKPMVIGKDITKVHLGKVALSSLTPNGFNSALQTIEQKAKS